MPCSPATTNSLTEVGAQGVPSPGKWAFADSKTMGFQSHGLLPSTSALGTHHRLKSSGLLALGTREEGERLGEKTQLDVGWSHSHRGSRETNWASWVTEI